MTEVRGCKKPAQCEAETDYGTGVAECRCGALGYLSKSGLLYNDPYAARADKDGDKK